MRQSKALTVTSSETDAEGDIANSDIDKCIKIDGEFIPSCVVEMSWSSDIGACDTDWKKVLEKFRPL